MSQNNDHDLNIYEITNRNTGEKSYQAATDAQSACILAGWLIGDCFMHVQTPRRKVSLNQEPLYLVKIPCKTCSWQWAECVRPADIECPCWPDTPDLNEWLKAATTAHLCDYVGQVLAKKDHRLHQKWVSTEDAIRELTPKP